MYVGVLLIFQIPGLPYVNPLLGNLRYILTGEAMEASIKYEVLKEQPFNPHFLRLALFTRCVKSSCDEVTLALCRTQYSINHEIFSHFTFK